MEAHMTSGPSRTCDCSAVIAAFRKFRAGGDLRKFPYAGVFRGPGIQFLNELLNVDAHVWEEDARAQGWHSEWLGNDLADRYAKQIRPARADDPVLWIKQRRRRKTTTEGAAQ